VNDLRELLSDADEPAGVFIAGRGRRE
jgi:hypothetical protein